MIIIAKKKTHEQYVQEVKEINENIEVIGIYNGINNKILHRCKICNFEWNAQPTNILHGTGCKQCSDRKKVKKQEVFVKELSEINYNVELLSEYTGANKPIKCLCKKCGYIWNPSANSLLQGCGCPKCAGLIYTNDNFIKDFKESGNPNYILLSEYVSAKTKIKYRCTVCNTESSSYPSTLLNGGGCKQCAKHNLSKSKRKTHEQFLNEVAELNSNILIIGNYNVAKDNIRCKCKICNYEWSPIADSILRGCGCPNCSGRANAKTRFYEKFNDTGNKNIELLSEYVDSHTKIKCKCKVCGHNWETTPDALVQGSGCRKCADKQLSISKSRNHEEYIWEVHNINPNIDVIGKYVNARKPILHKCKICNHEWMCSPENILQKHGCKKCASKRISESFTKTNEQFIAELKEINNDIVLLEEYSGSTTKLTCKCNKCNTEWLAIPSTLLKGAGCPKCNSSRGEKRINNYLNNNGLVFISQMKYKGLTGLKGGQLSYDFYLPKYNLLIEFQGEQHEHAKSYFGGIKQFEKQQEHDKRKRDYAKQNNINLLEIWYYDIDNIEEILKQTINNLKSKSVETIEVA